MPSTLITGTVGPVQIYKNRPAPNQSTVTRMWSRIRTDISANSTCSYKYVSELLRHINTISHHALWATVALTHALLSVLAHTVHIVHCYTRCSKQRGELLTMISYGKGDSSISTLRGPVGGQGLQRGASRLNNFVTTCSCMQFLTSNQHKITEFAS